MQLRRQYGVVLSVTLFILSLHLVHGGGTSLVRGLSVARKFKSARSRSDLLRLIKVVQPTQPPTVNGFRRGVVGPSSSLGGDTIGAPVENRFVPPLGNQAFQISGTPATAPDGVEVIDDPLQSEDHCTPQSVCVPVPVPKDPSGLRYHFPQCIELPQCTGACCDSAHNCHAQAVANVSVLVDQFLFIGVDEVSGVDKFEMLERLFVTMEKHNGCGCRNCKPTIDKCRTGRHELVDCVCRCRNKETLMLQCIAPHRWSDKTCECVCPLRRCPRNQRLDVAACRCVSRTVMGASTIGEQRLPAFPEQSAKPVGRIERSPSPFPDLTAAKESLPDLTYTETEFRPISTK